jgi:transposase-like protein
MCSGGRKVEQQTQAGMAEGQRWEYSRQFRADAVRRHLLHGMPAEDVCMEHGLPLELFKQWVEEFFAAGADAFDRQCAAQEFKLRVEVGRLELALARRRRLLAEVRRALADAEDVPPA